MEFEVDGVVRGLVFIFAVDCVEGLRDNFERALLVVLVCGEDRSEEDEVNIAILLMFTFN